MTPKYIEEHQIVLKYLRQQLSEHERTEFEEYWVQNPAIIHELEATAQLQVGLGKLHESGRLAGTASARAPRRLGWPVALAASLIVAAIGAVSWVRLRDAEAPTLAASPDQLRADSTALPALPVDVLRARGGLYDTVITLPKLPAVIELHILPDAQTPSGQYTATLLSIANDGARSTLGSVSGLPLTEDGSVIVYVDSTRLAPARYELRLANQAATQTPMSYLIKVDPPTGN
jgi:hypothetical protein